MPGSVGDNEELRDFFMRDAKARAAGADFFVLPDNTAHIAMESLAIRFRSPGSISARSCHEQARRMGTARWAFWAPIYDNGPVYPGALGRRGIDWSVPSSVDQKLVNDVISDELCLGMFKDCSRHAYVRIIEGLKQEGCDSVALVCTEIPLLVTPDISALADAGPTRLLAKAAVEVAIGGAADARLARGADSIIRDSLDRIH